MSNTPILDLSRISLIQTSTRDQLLDAKYVENLVVRLGFNNEILHEQPAIVRDNPGGLYIWQYPHQFSKYLTFLGSLTTLRPIRSYLEIGCRWGGSFIATQEYLNRVQNNQHPLASVVLDINPSPVVAYTSRPDSNALFLLLNSQTSNFKAFLEKDNKQFDLVFIDGDHSYQGVRNDYTMTKDHGNIFVFHDIASDACPGVVQFWKELNTHASELYEFYEFTEQYDEVYQQTGGKQYLGIGVAIRK